MKRQVLRMAAVLLLAVLLGGLLIGTATAQGSTKRVGLVVRFGDGTQHLEVVTVPASATALDVLNASALDVETKDYGGGFIALCRINAFGCPADDCFCQAESWAFWVQNASHTDWDMAPTGIAAYTPADREVIGFSWTGWDESWNPLVKPPVYTFEQLEPPAEVPEPATMALLGSGLLALGGYVGLRRRAR